MPPSVEAGREDVVLRGGHPHPSEGLSAIDIKRLELNLQHGEERPVDYNAIDNLVEVYNDIEKNKYFTVKEYATNTNKTEGDVKKMLKKANLMVEFLSFINAEGKYYVARDMELDGPLQEIMFILNKEKDEEEHERVRTPSSRRWRSRRKAT